MRYHFSPRGAFAVILPSTNSAVEAEFGQLIVPGASLHYGRILIKNPDKLNSDEAFEQFMVDLREEIDKAVSNIMTVQPDFVVMGMSSETVSITMGRTDGLRHTLTLTPIAFSSGVAKQARKSSRPG